MKKALPAFCVALFLSTPLQAGSAHEAFYDGPAHSMDTHPFWALSIERLEYAVHNGDDALRWKAEGIYGGDSEKLVVKTEGTKRNARSRPEDVELQALYSRAISDFFDLQLGLRQDFEPRPRRSHAVLGVEGLAPFFIETEAALFLSGHGETTARVEASCDLFVTQRLVLEPQLELDLSANDIPALGIGQGVTSLEAGLRLRYELTRDFAPYVGVSWERKFAETARLARAAGEEVEETVLLAGVKLRF